MPNHSRRFAGADSECSWPFTRFYPYMRDFRSHPLGPPSISTRFFQAYFILLSPSLLGRRFASRPGWPSPARCLPFLLLCQLAKLDRPAKACSQTHSKDYEIRASRTTTRQAM